MVPAPRTRYARCGGVDIAYQVLGDGPRDLLVITGSNVPIDCVDSEPAMAAFHQRLASFSRVIRFDLRGIGLSSHVPPESLSIDNWVADALAVVDAVGSERPVIFGPGAGTMVAVQLAARHGDRLGGLVLVNGAARSLWAPDYPAGVSADFVERFLEVGVRDDAVEQGFDTLALVAPSVAHNEAFRSWWDHTGNRAATPSMAQRISTVIAEGDVRELLPEVSLPTLIIHRAESRFVVVEHGRYLAEHLPHAHYVELPGADTLYWVGDTAPLLDEVEEFVTGARSGSAGAQRVLATVLFTDIVGSTDRAAQLGDQRWRVLLDGHDNVVREELRRFGGVEANTVGDGFVATFPSPSRAIDCAEAIVRRVHSLGVEVRAGIHVGELEVRGDDVAGMAVHIAARVVAVAAPGEVLVSSTVRDIVTGSPRTFADHGLHTLKGVPGEWRLFAAEPR